EAETYEHGTVFGGKKGDEAAAQELGQGDPESRAEAGEQQTFGEQLADKARPRRSDRLADGKLALAHAGAGEQQVSDIGAGDEEHQAGGGEKDPEGPLIFAAQPGNAGRTRRDGELVLDELLQELGAIPW